MAPRKRLIHLNIDPRNPVSLVQTVIVLLDVLAKYFDDRGRGDVARDVLGCTYAIIKGFKDVHS